MTKTEFMRALDRYAGTLANKQLEDSRILIVWKKDGEMIIRKVVWDEREEREMVASVKRHYQGAKVIVFTLDELEDWRVIA